MSFSPTQTVDIAAEIGATRLFGVSVNIVVLVVVFALIVFAIVRSRTVGFSIATVRVKDPFSVFECEIRPTGEVRQLAHEAWTELMTRKAALPFEPEHDVVVEVFDSWYALFKELRLIIRRIPATTRKSNSDAEKLVTILTNALNLGVRPALTNWQARFRRWYSEALKDPTNQGRSPQDIQRDFPDYVAMEGDLIAVSAKMVELATELHSVAVRK